MSNSKKKWFKSTSTYTYRSSLSFAAINVTHRTVIFVLHLCLQLNSQIFYSFFGCYCFDRIDNGTGFRSLSVMSVLTNLMMHSFIVQLVSEQVKQKSREKNSTLAEIWSTTSLLTGHQ